MDLLKKLNHKLQKELYIYNSPKELDPIWQEFSKFLTIKKDQKIKKGLEFGLAFVKTEEEVQKYSSILAKSISEEGLLWFAYPKGSSKKYKSEINRDKGWKILGELGFEGVRMVAIDEDWSAMRFKKAEKIKTMLRKEKLAMSQKGKARVSGLKK